MLKIPEITDQQIEQFNKDGFLIIKNAFNPDDTSRIQTWATEISERPEKSGDHWVYHEKSKIDPDKDLINRIENISPFHQGFSKLSHALESPVAQLFNEQAAALFKEKINFKMPGGGDFKPHQDSQAG